MAHWYQRRHHVAANMTAPDSAFDAIVRRARSLGAEEQVAYLRDACGTDLGLYSDALHALESGNGGGWWDDAASDAEALASPARELVGHVIGNYRVVDLLGTGGMGTVVLAERADHQFSHKV